MAVRPVVVYPHQILTTPTRPVDPDGEDLRELVRDMIETMHAEAGVGLAANQVGDDRRLLVLDMSGGEDPDQVQVLINPEIVETHGKQQGEEGCLSFPGIFESITRPEMARVRYVDRDGKSAEQEMREFLARAVLHEVDHLDGITFLQRMSPLKRKLVLRRIKKLREAGEWPETVLLEPRESRARE